MQSTRLVRTAGTAFGLLSLLGGTTTLADVLHDNGKPDGVNGYSNGTVNYFGFRRTLLDDFVVPAGEAWTLEGFRWNHLWITDPVGTGAEIAVWSDAGGVPGIPLQALDVTSYSETATGRGFFSWNEFVSWAEFEPVALAEGHYWIELAIIGPQVNFWLTATPVQHSECWVNYEDMNGLESGSDIFGVPSDLVWSVEGIREIFGDWACCFGDGGCMELPNLACEAQGGIFLGAGVRCDLDICGAPGACCRPDNACVIESELFCARDGGTYGGIASQCADVQCSECTTFLPESRYATREDPRTAALADLDGDGDLDLVTINDTDSITILDNAGDGSFVQTGAYNTGTASSSLALGDVDGDDDIDVTVASRHADQLRVFHNIKGTGIFQLGVGYDVDAPYRMDLADLDGDLDLDAAVLRFNDSVLDVLMNDGSGVFGPPVAYPTATDTSLVVLGDLDGDLDPDAAIAGRGLTVMLNNGDGTFGTHTTYEAPLRLWRLTLSDLDGDDDLDVAAVNDSPNPADVVSLFLNDGDGVFVLDARYGAGNDPFGIAAGDFDGDAIPDLVTSNTDDDNVSILLNNGDGTFGPSIFVDTGEYPYTPSLGDLDGDGDTDIAVTNARSDDISVLRNDCPFCPEDLDGSGAVEFGDILAILAAWGETGIRREDLDRSGVVDFGDLLVLLAAWGPCLET